MYSNIYNSITKYTLIRKLKDIYKSKSGKLTAKYVKPLFNDEFFILNKNSPYIIEKYFVENDFYKYYMLIYNKNASQILEHIKEKLDVDDWLIIKQHSLNNSQFKKLYSNLLIDDDDKQFIEKSINDKYELISNYFIHGFIDIDLYKKIKKNPFYADMVSKNKSIDDILWNITIMNHKKMLYFGKDLKLIF
jgi:hypothetical protein